MKRKRTASLIAGSIIYLLIGLIYAWSIFVAPLEKEFGWTRTQVSATFTITMILFCLGGIIGGFIISKKTPRFIIRLSAAFIAAGLLLSSTIDTIWGLYLTYGVFCGFGIGLCYITTISAVTRWFPGKQGIISGILLMGYGLGALFFGPVVTALITIIGWRATFVIMGLSFAVLLTVCAIWIEFPRQEDVLQDLTKGDSSKEEKSLTLKEAMHTSSFWICFLWTIIIGSSGLAVVGHAAVGAMDLGAAASAAAIFTGVVSASNGTGRILAGIIFDTCGRKFCLRMDSLIMVAGMAILFYSVYANSLHTFFLGGAFVGLAFGTLPTTISAFVNQFYGSKNYSLNLSVMNLNVIPAALIGPLTAGAIRTATGSYFYLFLMMLCLGLIAFTLQFFIKGP